MKFTLLDLDNVLRRLGRGTVWYAHDGTDDAVGDPIRWDPESGEPLQLAPLFDTEGDIVFNPNGSIATLTLPEISGDEVIEATHTGFRGVLEAPGFLADPDLIPIVHPRGRRGGGSSRVEDVAERTVVVFPENFFRTAAGEYSEAEFTGGAWTVGGSALTAAQETLLARTLWIPRCYMDMPRARFLGGHGDAGKNIETLMVQAMRHPGWPNHYRQFYWGDPADIGVDLSGAS